MNKEYLVLILNEIDNYSLELQERLLPNVRKSCKFGLHKGKIHSVSWITMRLRELANALEEYDKEDFSLDDMQDYGELF